MRVGKQEEEATWIKGLDLEVDDEDVAQVMEMVKASKKERIEKEEK